MKKPRVLILNCYSDNHRGAAGNARFVPQAMTGAVLAGHMHREKVEVALDCEFHGGPFEDLDKLRRADLLVLTGLNPAFDRMKQVSAYARTVNPGIAVAMGGPLARALPGLSRRYFDHVCTGDVEQIGSHDIGRAHIADPDQVAHVPRRLPRPLHPPSCM